MKVHINANGLKRAQIELLVIGRVRLHDDLELIIMLQAVRVLSVTSISGTARGLNISHIPRLWPKRAQYSRGMERSGPDFGVKGL